MAYTGQASDQQFNPLIYGDLPQSEVIYRFTNVNGSSAFNFASITSVQITGNVLTVQGANTFTAGQVVEFYGMTAPNDFLNGAVINITSVSGPVGSPPTYTQFTANYVHADFGPSAEANGYVLTGQLYVTLGVLSQEDPSVSGNFNNIALTSVMALPTASDIYMPVSSAPVVWPSNGFVGISGSSNHEGAGRIYGTTPVQTVQVASNVLTVTPQSGNRYSPWIVGTTVTFESFTTATFLNRATITATSVTANVVTVTCANHFQTGQLIRMQGLTTSTFLNWVTLTVLSTGLSTSQFEANFTHANYGSTADTGFAAPVATVTSSSYSGGGAAQIIATFGTASNFGPTTDTTGIIIGGTFQSQTAGVFASAINQQSAGMDMLCGIVVDTGLQGHTGTIAGLFFTQQGDQSGYADNMACIYMQDQHQTLRSRVTNVWAIYEQGALDKNQFGIVIAVTSMTTPSMILTGTLTDHTSSVGTSGQVLTSTGTGVSWANSSINFAAITSGTNNAATMVVGGGATLTFNASGSPAAIGIINANEIYGVPVDSTQPTVGQVLTAVQEGSPATLTAKWQSPSSPSTQTVRDGPHAIVTATQGGPYTINFTTPFADNNYTVQVTLVCSEAVTVAVTSIVSVADVQLQAAGVGVIVTVANADSITHNVTIHVTAIHD